MIKLNKPQMLGSDVFSDCVAQVANSDLRTRLTACSEIIAESEKEFEAKITKGEMYTILRNILINGNVQNFELKSIYNNQLLKKDNCRQYYDKLLLSAPNNLCPYCAHRDVSTLDHYLPKSSYPEFSVSPINLIPSCRDCNTGKKVEFPTKPEEETLHPYYDDIGSVSWLEMNVNRTSPLTVSFTIRRPDNWTDLLFSRVLKHFEFYSLNQLYSLQSARQLVQMNNLLKRLYYSGGGSKSIKKNLEEMWASSFSVNKNSWQTAFYHGLSSDDWFCEEGFKNIGV